MDGNIKQFFMYLDIATSTPYEFIGIQIIMLQHLAGSYDFWAWWQNPYELICFLRLQDISLLPYVHPTPFLRKVK